MLKLDALRRLPLPIPDAALRAAVRDIETAESSFALWKQSADLVLREAFDGPTPQASRAHIIDSSRILRQRLDAAGLLDDPAQIYATRYPQPIAVRWSIAQNEWTRGHGEAYIRAALDCYETLLAYAANVALALARFRGLELSAASDLRRKIRRGQGPTIGTWRAILQEVGGRRELRTPEGASSTMGRLGALLAESSDAAAASRLLSDTRNDLAHQRTILEPQEVAERISDALGLLMARADFLMDLAAVHVRHTVWDDLTRTATLEVQHLVGDRVVMPDATMQGDAPTIEEGSLYVTDLESQFHLLRPFVQRRQCPECHNLSTFHIDRIVGDKVSLRSLQDGHQMITDDTAAFEAVGLL
ncbi:hypothetical protein ASG23_15395 [Cellulomonas sp. Leaf395]|nr:hypothetical protein ASG23_15395 [Cellulomonas sp. Leaf395]